MHHHHPRRRQQHRHHPNTTKRQHQTADVEQQPQWNRGVKQSRVVARRGNTKSVHQVLQWSFLALRGDMHLALDQREDPRALTISTEMTGGTMMRQFRSR